MSADRADDLAPQVLLIVRAAVIPESLQAVLVSAALDWAREIGAGSTDVVHEPPGARLGATFAAGVRRVRAERGAGPVLVVWPEIAQLRPVHAAGALTDLAAGADAVIGPIFAGGFYLVGVSELPARLLTLPDAFWHGENALGLAIPQPGEPPFELGLLRAERGLSTPTDVAAALVDPSTPEVVVRALASDG